MLSHLFAAKHVDVVLHIRAAVLDGECMTLAVHIRPFKLSFLGEVTQIIQLSNAVAIQLELPSSGAIKLYT